ncbi:unnamed protein product [Haemonchus placei]|uniref:Transposase n=1 Tax=Haemonchus placei TaxID=6290 RepID=A0A0N4WL94_HAEPC|nr:unnamed protein product [Haemonchus placei]
MSSTGSQLDVLLAKRLRWVRQESLITRTALNIRLSDETACDPSSLTTSYRPRPRYGAGALGALVGLAAVSTDSDLGKCAMSHIHGPHKRAAPRSAMPFMPPELVELFLAGLSA